MAVNDELMGFVREALGRGLARPQVENALKEAGWASARVRGALGAFAPVEFPIPVPRPRPSLHARGAFLYLLLFSTLFTVATSLGAVVFRVIEQAIPDPAEATYVGDYLRDSMRFSVSCLIVSAPVFFLMARLTRKEEQRESTSRTTPIRRWLTYLALFIGASVLICDVTSLVYYFLGGDLTLRFVLKAATVAAIAGTGFWYYLTDLRRGVKELAI